MRPMSAPPLLLLGSAAAGFGAVLADYYAARGEAVPVSGWVTGAVLLVLAAVLLGFGLPLRRYMHECAERAEHPTLAPRRYQLDMTQAFRTVIFARACACTGAILGGLFTGLTAFFVISGTGTLTGAVLPTGFAALAGVALAVCGVIVERWGTLPPEDGPGAGVQKDSTPA